MENTQIVPILILNVIGNNNTDIQTGYVVGNCKLLKFLVDIDVSPERILLISGSSTH